MEIIIEPGRVDRNYWGDLWRYRELFQVLAWRDVAVRYKQTLIGAAWAVIRPLLTMIVFTFVFGRVAQLPTEGTAPYALMVLCGILPWTFFASALTDASNSVLTNANLIGKVYFPRLIVPAASIAVALVDFLVSLAILAVSMIWYRFMPGWQIVVLPAFVLMGMAAAVGPALWVTAVNVRYRDFRYVVPFLAQLGLYISPVGFSSAAVPSEWRLLYSLNPMVAVIDGFRWSILGGQTPLYWPGLAASAATTTLFLWIGMRTFRGAERRFADLI